MVALIVKEGGIRYLDGEDGLSGDWGRFLCRQGISISIMSSQASLDLDVIVA